MIRAGVSRARCPTFVDEVEARWMRGLGALEITLEHAFRQPEGADLAQIRAAEGDGFLIGHGVHYSLLSEGWSPVDASWLAQVRDLAERFRFRWVTEHFGCVRAGGVWAAPLSVPFDRAALVRGRDRLARLADAVQVPVGLENLAFAWSADDARAQADFVDALLEPVDGLMVLDLHNLWCQAVNYGIDPVALLERQPLERVRQVHLAGGSWSDWPEGRFRRDTHDGPVPEEVWSLLPEAIARCRGLEVVTLERLPPAIEADPGGWRAEVGRLIAAADRAIPAVQVPRPRRHGPTDGHAAVDGLFRSAGREPGELVEVATWLADADPRALRTASALLAKWGRPIPGAAG